MNSKQFLLLLTLVASIRIGAAQATSFKGMADAQSGRFGAPYYRRFARNAQMKALVKESLLPRLELLLERHSSSARKL